MAKNSQEANATVTAQATPSLFAKKIDAFISREYEIYLSLLGEIFNDNYSRVEPLPNPHVDRQYLVGPDSDLQHQEVDKIRDAAALLKQHEIPQYKKMEVIAQRLTALVSMQSQIDFLFKKQISGLIGTKGGNGPLRKNFESHLQAYFLKQLEEDLFPKITENDLPKVQSSLGAAGIAAAEEDKKELATRMEELVDIPGGTRVAIQRIDASRSNFVKDLSMATGLAIQSNHR